MILLMACCFCIMVSYSLGLFFSFSFFVASCFLAILAFAIHYTLYRLGLTRPPGNFFFIMSASIAICTPFHPEKIPEKIGFMAMGTILTCGIGLIYSLLTLKEKGGSETLLPTKNPYTNTVESIIFGVFVGLSLGKAFLLKLENPYWVPVSCAAVMQGASSKHVWLRGVQRIAGTLAGLGLTWLIATFNPSSLFIAISIILLQMIVEFLVVRNYTVAVVFITILAVFLAESGSQMTRHTDLLFTARLVDIILGSFIGVIGGWVLFNEHVHYHTTLRIRKAKFMIKKKSK
ncbi:FUSC family protein [Olivibacter sp. XZL3]|uniref:FUSC family protein n=1 Tax=Olivibacter sp. XZL3 TaxID=1735116 RepID=UPI00197FA8C0|nr:FUSC family protein [Olivibacter sp. XZL3]